MENEKYLGIYISKNRASAVCVCGHGHDCKPSGFVSIQPTAKEGQSGVTVQDAAADLAKACGQKFGILKEIPAVVALDCALYMQHAVHSEFTDSKQIAQTIRFDTEEVIAGDVGDLAIAFETVSTDEKGSNLSVYTSKKQTLSDIILTLQSNGIDPVAIEPDINSLSHYIGSICSSDMPKEQTLFGFLSSHSGYFTFFSEDGKQTIKRTFFINKSQNHHQLILREIPITLASVKGNSTVSRIRLFDSCCQIDAGQFTQMYGKDSAILNIDIAASPDQPPQDIDSVDYAVAYGAALANLQKQIVNFRDDYLPYLGGKKKIEKAVRFSGMALFILAVIAGLMSQYVLMAKQKPVKQLHEKLVKQYCAIMNVKSMTTKTPIKSLEKELRRIETLRSGAGGASDESVTGKLTLMLSAFNKCAAAANLNIETVSIGEKEIRIVGDTASRQNTLKFFDTLKQNKLEVMQPRLDTKGNRDIFTITLEVKKGKE